MLISCSDDGSGDKEKGYVDPGDWTGKVVNANKAYTIAGESCGPNQECNAIIYQNKLNDTDFVGLAVNNAHAGTPSTFNLKIYWQESSTTSLPTSNDEFIELSLSEYTIKISKDSNVYTSTTDPLKITITYKEDGYYNIEFTDKIDLNGFTINKNDSIQAVKYP